MNITISQPMLGRDIEDIKEDRNAVIKKIRELGGYYVNNIIGVPDDGWENSKSKAIFCLSKSIEIISECEAVIFLKGWDSARGCRIEHDVCEKYGIKIFYEDDFMKAYNIQL